VPYFYPGWVSSYPVANWHGRVQISQLYLYGSGQNHLFKQHRKDVDVSDQDKIIDRTRIADDKLHAG
jgi:hypothetical protein